MSSDKIESKIWKGTFIFKNEDKKEVFVVIDSSVIPLTLEKNVLNDSPPLEGKQKSSFPLTAREKQIKGSLNSPFISREKVLEDIFSYVRELEAVEETAKKRLEDHRYIKLAAEIKVLEEDIAYYKSILFKVKIEFDEECAKQEAIFPTDKNNESSLTDKQPWDLSLE